METVSLTRIMLEIETYWYIVHRGFKERIFPEKNTSSRSPYGPLSIARVSLEAWPDYILTTETIARGVDIVGRDLIRRRGENAEINVYFTGEPPSPAPTTSLLTLSSRSLAWMRNLHYCLRWNDR